MKQDKTRWEPTKTPGLYVRQPGGGFYARVTLNGKRSWRSLQTDKLREAQGKLRELQSGRTRKVTTRVDDKLHAALEKTIAARSVRRAIDRPLKSSSLAYHAEILACAKKHFPDRPLADFEHAELMRGIAATGLSRSRQKALFELLKQTFRRGVDNKQIESNPLAEQKIQQVPIKDRKLPSREQMEEMVRLIPELFPRYGHRAALSLRFLMFSGMRLGEARAVQWGDIQDGEITIRGGDEGLKWRDQGATRTLHINPPLQAALDDIAKIYGKKGRVMPAKNIIPQLKAACKKVGAMEMNHHDLKSWFITWNITSGTDVSTLSGWVGTSPKVLLERYTAVQDELKKKAAAKLV